MPGPLRGIALVDLVTVLAFVGFFAGTALAFWFHDRRFVRSGYLVAVFATLLVVNLVGGGVLPFITYHKYTEAGDEEYPHYEVYVVDEHGDELRYDTRAARPISITQLYHHLDEDEYEETGRYLLERAREYRTELEDGGEPVSSRLTFPLPARNYEWSADELQQYGTFVGIVVYEVTPHYEPGSHEIEYVERTEHHAVTEEDRER